MKKRHQVFISSTYIDLIPEREQVQEVVLSMFLFPVGMEMFSAADEKQWEIIKRNIDDSDFYVLIIGRRYGSIIDSGPDKGISYTEKEYRYAKSKGIPILAYIKEDSAITAEKVEFDAEKQKKLQLFLEGVKNKHVIQWFSTVDELGKKLSVSLHMALKKNNDTDEALVAGSCGIDARWELMESGKLTITGKGQMSSSPWQKHHFLIRQVMIEHGIQSVCDFAFANCMCLETVDLGSVVRIGESAFENCTSLKQIIIPSSVEDICNYAFRGCIELRIVRFEGEFPIENSFRFPSPGQFNIGQYESYLPFDGVDDINFYYDKRYGCSGKRRVVKDAFLYDTEDRWPKIITYTWGAKKANWHSVDEKIT